MRSREYAITSFYVGRARARPTPRSRSPVASVHAEAERPQGRQTPLKDSRCTPPNNEITRTNNNMNTYFRCTSPPKHALPEVSFPLRPKRRCAAAGSSPDSARGRGNKSVSGQARGLSPTKPPPTYIYIYIYICDDLTNKRHPARTLARKRRQLRQAVRSQ